MNNQITECDLSALLKFTKEIDSQNETALKSITSELESTRREYKKVVEQNTTLQKDLQIATMKLDLIKDLLDRQNVLEPMCAFLKENINRIMEISL